MGHVRKTPAGNFRANWRDPAGKKRSKTFATKREAGAYLADVEVSINQGSYVAPAAGRMTFAVFTAQWAETRRSGARNDERVKSILRTHLLPTWAEWPLARIDHLSVQRWVTQLGDRMAPASVGKVFSVFRAILRAAVRTRRLATDPTAEVTAPSTYQPRPTTAIIARADLIGRLLPVLPVAHRALVATAAGAGLRWGECTGLAWGSVDLTSGRLRVVQVAVETARGLSIRPYPKSRAGVRTIPLPAFLLAELEAHRQRTHPDGDPDPRALVFAAGTGTPVRRSNFRRQVWRPALVRAGLLGSVVERPAGVWRGSWPTGDGGEQWCEFTSQALAVAHVAALAAGGLRFHDLRHSYATWLVTAGTPINDVQAVMGHEQASTTLNRYTHRGSGSEGRILAAFEDPAAFSPPQLEWSFALWPRSDRS